MAILAAAPVIERVTERLAPGNEGFNLPQAQRFTAEVWLVSMAAALTIPVHMRKVYLDEQSFFDRVLGNLTGPRGGR